ncbi:MAG: chaperone NapD [Bacillota bacterium]
MVISSLVIHCNPGSEQQLIAAAGKIEGLEPVTFVEGQVIFLLESHSFKEAHQVLEKELKVLPGVLGVYPVYLQESGEATL